MAAADPTAVDSYQSFLNAKRFVAPSQGIAAPPPLSGKLFAFQRDITTWALRKGRAALLCAPCHRFVHSKANTGGEFLAEPVRWIYDLPQDVVKVPVEEAVAP